MAGIWRSADATASSPRTPLLVTPQGELWMVQEDAGLGAAALLVALPAGLNQGHLFTQGNFFSGTLARYSAPGAVMGPASITGNFVQERTLTHTLAVDGLSRTSTAVYSPSFDQPAALAAVAGFWRWAQGAVTVDAAGAVVAQHDGCTWRASLTPDASGKNFFRLVGQFGPAPCASPNAQARGVAFVDEGHLVVGLLSAGWGAAYVGARAAR